MTEAATPNPPPASSSKRNPDKLELRAAPGRLVRFKRGLVIGVAALGSTAVLGVTMMALQGPVLRIRGQADELYNTERKPTPDGLAALPGDYSQVKPQTPQLGPPLPGDLGRPILQRQRQLGIAPEGQELRPEEQRLAQQAIQAKESDIFFRIENRSQQSTPAAIDQPLQLAAGETVRRTPDPEGNQNNQQRKLDFLNQRDTSGIYNPHALQTPASSYQLMAGSVIAASLITGINSDLPGLVVAQVTENVYDTVTGQVLLIPQGSRLIGTYDSAVAFGQSRALLVWQRLVMPDGSSIQLENLPATDAAGYAGLEDEVDHHTWQLLKGIAMATLLGVGTELSFGSNESDLVRAIRQSTQENVAQAGQRITEKNLNVQPTITVRPGWPVRVLVQRDIVLRPYRGPREQ
ncbi:TrbI/VirB10 family protein [Chelativorans alearense]|uniref:TrbI/VirB10 family protein n=1 Tax=Chelativorans alearense TaxID=2681495 RepID=UPI0013D86612|nr:TrbI/VirB10 family protein [Chelativorans alearense]